MKTNLLVHRVSPFCAKTTGRHITYTQPTSISDAKPKHNIFNAMVPTVCVLDLELQGDEMGFCDLWVTSQLNPPQWMVIRMAI